MGCRLSVAQLGEARLQIGSPAHAPPARSGTATPRRTPWRKLGAVLDEPPPAALVPSTSAALMGSGGKPSLESIGIPQIGKKLSLDKFKR